MTMRGKKTVELEYPIEFIQFHSGSMIVFIGDASHTTNRQFMATDSCLPTPGPKEMEILCYRLLVIRLESAYLWLQ